MDIGMHLARLNLAHRIIRRFVRAASGQTVVEYALILGLVSVVVLGSVMSAGQSVDAAWTSIADQIVASFLGF